MDTKALLASLPQTPGVYIYKDSSGNILYIGKAVNLKNRVSQYFARNDALGAKTSLLVSQINKVETVSTADEFDALLLEAKLIHDHQPKYNLISKDDKSPLYIILTIDEVLPRVLFQRKQVLQGDPLQKRAVFGPFQSSRIARSLLRSLRRSIPYCTQKERNGRPCFYTHLGLCEPCPSVITKMPDEAAALRHKLTHLYRRNLIRLKDVLSGQATSVIGDMEKEMVDLARKNKFEEAAVIKAHIDNLIALKSRRNDPMIYMNKISQAGNIVLEEINSLRHVLLPYYPTLPPLQRIECIDIAHTGGKESTGSMVVLTNGMIDSHQYRKFRIRHAQKDSDVGMIAEVIKRRLKHPEWPYPNLLIVDGGKGQVGAATNVMTESNISIPVIGLAKRMEEIIIPKIFKGAFTVRLSLSNPGLQILQRLRDEAHRFARRYHHLLRKKQLLAAS